MGREQVLLDRIAAMADGGRSRYETSSEEDLDALMDSVRRHLTRLVNARHGLSEAMPDYGLPALTDLTIGSSDYVRAIQDAIRVAVEKYEPRLRRVRVSRVANDDAPQTLSFRVEATLIASGGEHRVYYETTMSGGGRFDVLE